MGFGFAWGQARKDSQQDQYNLELFYRVQVTPRTNLTPDVQVVVNPSEDKSRGSIWLLSLRIRTVF